MKNKWHTFFNIVFMQNKKKQQKTVWYMSDSDKFNQLLFDSTFVVYVVYT